MRYHSSNDVTVRGDMFRGSKTVSDTNQRGYYYYYFQYALCVRVEIILFFAEGTIIRPYKQKVRARCVITSVRRKNQNTTNKFHKNPCQPFTIRYQFCQGRGYINIAIACKLFCKHCQQTLVTALGFENYICLKNGPCHVVAK